MGGKNDVAKWDSKPIVPGNLPDIPQDDDATEIMICKNPVVDAQLKRGLELMVWNYSEKGKNTDEAICNAISTPESPMPIWKWRAWQRSKNFKALYKAWLTTVVDRYNVDSLSCRFRMLGILDEEIRNIEKEVKEEGKRLSLKDLRTVGGLIQALEKTQPIFANKVAINQDNRQVNIDIDTDTVNIGGVKEQLEELQKHLEANKQRINSIAEVTEVEDPGGDDK